MLQSIDRPVTAPDCSGVDTRDDRRGPARRHGDSGAVRLRGPAHVRRHQPAQPEVPALLPQPVRLAHPHARADRAATMYAYVPSYPLGAHITPAGRSPAVRPAGPDLRGAPQQDLDRQHPAGRSRGRHGAHQGAELGHRALRPGWALPAHGRPDRGPGTAPAFQSCHDHQAFMPRKIMVAACAGDAAVLGHQRPRQPDLGRRRSRTRTSSARCGRRPGDAGERALESFDFMHNSTVTWDGQRGGDHGRVWRRRRARAATATRHRARLHVVLPAGGAGHPGRRVRRARPLHHPAAAGRRAVRVAQRQRVADASGGWDCRRRRSTRPGTRWSTSPIRRAERDRVSDVETSAASPTRGRPTGTTTSSTSTAASTAAGPPPTAGFEAYAVCDAVRRADRDPRLEVAEPADAGDLAAARRPEGQEGEEGLGSETSPAATSRLKTPRSLPVAARAPFSAGPSVRLSTGSAPAGSGAPRAPRASPPRDRPRPQRDRQDDVGGPIRTMNSLRVRSRPRRTASVFLPARRSVSMSRTLLTTRIAVERQPDREREAERQPVELARAARSRSR